METLYWTWWPRSSANLGRWISEKALGDHVSHGILVHSAANLLEACCWVDDVLCSLLQDNAVVTGGKTLKSLITDMDSRGP